jgi:hypothetical protein
MRHDKATNHGLPLRAAVFVDGSHLFCAGIPFSLPTPCGSCLCLPLLRVWLTGVARQVPLFIPPPREGQPRSIKKTPPHPLQREVCLDLLKCSIPKNHPAIPITHQEHTMFLIIARNLPEIHAYRPQTLFLPKLHLPSEYFIIKNVLLVLGIYLCQLV